MKSNLSVLFLKMMFFVSFLRTLCLAQVPSQEQFAPWEKGVLAVTAGPGWLRTCSGRTASQQRTIWPKTSVALRSGDLGPAQGREDGLACLLPEASLLYLLHLVYMPSVFNLCIHAGNTSKSRFCPICASSLLL